MSTQTIAIARLTADGADTDLARHIIEFDPRRPSGYRFAAAPGSAEAQALATTFTPDPIPWPAGLAPQPQHVDAADTDPLPRADALVVTYTVAEGYALADVLTPGVDTQEWTSYRNNWPALKQLIRGRRAPALQSDRAGLWYLTKIGDRTVVVMKSDLHPSTDGANLPIRTLWRQIIQQVQPKVVITTGTAGGVQQDTLLGDVVVARTVRWDCTKTFGHASFAHDSYTSPITLGGREFSKAVKTLIPVNAKQLPPAARTPKVWQDSQQVHIDAVTTDFFAFDDTSDHYRLRSYDPRARAVEMDDAALGLACIDLAGAAPAWISIRNASDPQMTGADLAAEKAQAAKIYERYGYWTSIGSAIACWSVISGLN